MDAKTSRTAHIRQLVSAAGGPAEFARLYGGQNWSQAQVSQWISPTNPKGIGHALAREIELRTGRPAGSLDRPPEAASQSVGLDADKMRLAARFLEDLFAAHGAVFIVSEQISLLQAVYVEFTSTDTPNLVALTTKYGKLLGESSDDGQDEARGTGADGGSGDPGRAKKAAVAAGKSRRSR